MLTVILAVLVIAFLFFQILWFPAWLSRKFGAERGQKRWVLLYLITANAFSLLILFVFVLVVLGGDGLSDFKQANLDAHGTIGFVFSLFGFILSVFIFSKCVELSFWRSMAVQFISYVPVIVLLVVVGIFAIAYMEEQTGMSYEQMALVSEGGITEEVLVKTADNICMFEGDNSEKLQQVEFYNMLQGQYLTENSDRYAQRSAKRIEKRVTTCLEGKSRQTVALATEAVRVDNEQAENIADDEVENNLAEIEEEETRDPAYHKVKLSDLGEYIGGSVIVKRKSAGDMKGKLLAIENGTLKVQQRRYGGNMTFSITRNDIASIEVYY